MTRPDRPGEGAAGDGEREPVRLQKVLAAAGLGSRRACEELIAGGRVSVDGERAELGMRVDPGRAVIRVDGERINVRDDLVYLVLNKPRGVLSTMSDERGRRTVADLVAEHFAATGEPAGRLFHVGRLDGDTEGLLLLTNDGDLAHRLMHPAFGVSKTYLATVPGPVGREAGRTLLAGVELEDGPARADGFRVVSQHGDQAIVELVLHEGRNRIVRRMLAAVGHPVLRLVRTEIGPVRLAGQRPGTLRELTKDELARLYRLVDATAAGDGPAEERTAR